jgi:hypothetical protein
MLLKLQHDVKELKRQQDHNTQILHEIHGPRDIELQLPCGLQLPMASEDHIAAMELALDDVVFKKQLV